MAATVFAGRVVRIEPRGAVIRGAEGEILARGADLEVGARVAYQIHCDSSGEHAAIVDRTSRAFVGVNEVLARAAAGGWNRGLIPNSRWGGE